MLDLCIKRSVPRGTLAFNKMNTIIAVANQKGGVGKTTTAINLSASLAFYQRRVLILDFDPQGMATAGLGKIKERGKGVYPSLMNGLYVMDYVLPTELDNLYICPCSPELAGFEAEIFTQEEWLHTVERMIKHAFDPEFLGGNEKKEIVGYLMRRGERG